MLIFNCFSSKLFCETGGGPLDRGSKGGSRQVKTPRPTGGCVGVYRNVLHVLFNHPYSIATIAPIHHKSILSFIDQDSTTVAPCQPGSLYRE